MDAASVRERLYGFLSADLVGPAHGPDEILEEPPRIRYLAGVLFPQESLRNESAAAGGVEDTDDETPTEVDEFEEFDDQATEVEEEAEAVSTGDESEASYDDTLTLANSYRPSAMGLSFFVRSATETLIVAFTAAVYESQTLKDEKGFNQTRFERRALQMADLQIDMAEEALFAKGVRRELSPGLWVKGIFRRRSNGQVLVTISMFNSAKEHDKNANTFYQCGFSVSSVQSDEEVFVEYQSAAKEFRDDEEAGLAMLYRDRREFAVGHGCAASWSEVGTKGACKIETAVLPSQTVPPVNPVSEDEAFLDMHFLAGNCEDPSVDIPNELDRFCTTYRDWIADRKREITHLAAYGTTPKRHIARCEIALERMHAGVEALRSDETVLTAFTLANRAMLMQQYHARRRRSLDSAWVPLPGVDEYSSDFENRMGFWRTFQLAFILMNLRSLSSGGDVDIDGTMMDEKELVDLIWFPTGGGKTEAYLGLAAFMIFWRRQQFPNDRGCKVLMRYTLRLLTSQQFQRAASLICACEVIRREAPDLYGSSPITIGLYVGQSLTPNKEKEALQALAKMVRGRDQKNPFQLLHCPWCGTDLNNRDRYGYADRRNRMIFLCPSRAPEGEESCPFSLHANHLPICVVDDTIYKDPPTLVIATVDKLAMLAWRDEAGAILMDGGGPELIIQDELHLISGPLGSMVGLYEGVFEYMSSRNGSRPKIIASTATIRRAQEQCRALYDRPMFQFPPAGLDVSDSFFAKEDENSVQGRLYVGFLPTAASSPLTAQIRSIVAMQQGLMLVCPDDVEDNAVDPYWTLVQYFGSLKELGHAATFVTADIPEFIPTMHRRYEIESQRKRWMRSAEELTSRKNEDEIPQILKRLEVGYKAGAERQEQALDTLLATNMISVGVDVDRLGLMMIVTQPKGTSEYIQASSRVGRSIASPGLVFTLYNAARPRDRSHYEHFCGYHQAFYQYVEPTSVTPFSPPAMHRALHAVLIIAGRHIAKWRLPSDIDVGDSAFQDFLAFLRERVSSVDADHLTEFDAIVNERLDDWIHRAVDKWGDFDDSNDAPVLMRPAGRPPREHDRSSWETPTSMRNVDVECQAALLPRFSNMEVGNGVAGR